MIARREEAGGARGAFGCAAEAVSAMGTALFYVLVTAHVLSALTGFASTGFAGTYAARAGRLLGPPKPRPDDGGAREPGEVEELQRYFARPARLWWALWAVPVFGAAAVAAQPDGDGFDQLWVMGALVVWLVAVMVTARGVIPALHRLGELLSGAFAPGGTGAAGPGTLPPEQAREAAASGVLASRAAALCDGLFLVALALMIWQPN